MKLGFVMVSAFAAAFVLAPQHRVIAQEAPAMRERPGPSEADQAKMKMWIYNSLEKYLKLSGDTSRKFRPLFDEFSDSRGKLMHEQMELTRKITDAVDDESVPISQLKTLADRFKAVNRSLWQDREKFLKRSAVILNDRQMIKLLIFEEKMKSDLFRKFREPHKDGRPGGGPPPFPGAK